MKKKTEETKRLRKRFGTSSDWVDVTLPLTNSEMLKIFGERCEEFEPYCMNCSAWLEWNRTGKATVSVERTDVVKLLIS